MRIALFAAAGALAASTPVCAEVVASGEGGFVSRNVVEVAASPQDAWKALVAPSGWWNGEHTYSGDAANLWLDAQATGCFCEKLPLAKDAAEGQRPGSIEHMRVVYVQPGRALRMVGALGPLQSEAVTGTLTITLKPVTGGTRVLWEYVVGGFMRYKPDQIGPTVDGVMASQLARLGGRLGLLAPTVPVGRVPAATAPAAPAAGSSDEPVADEFDKVLAPSKPRTTRP